MKRSHWIRISAFVCIFALLFLFANSIIANPDEYSSFVLISGFYDEPEDSLDAVYIGSSNCFTYWNPAYAWKNHGLAIWSYANNAQPFEAAEYLIREARKTQPEALYIVNTNAVRDEITGTDLHYLLDYMPASMNKINLINALSEHMGYSFAERLEYFFPWIRFHNRPISYADFNRESDGMKGSPYLFQFLHRTEDVSASFEFTKETNEIAENMEQCIDSLLDYCDAEKVNVLFVSIPRAERTLDEHATINAVNNMIRSRGYTVLTLTDEIQTIGLDPATDYYNKPHTNIHGSFKFTEYLSKYLIANYGFEDKRGNDAYSSWDTAWELYVEKINPYVLDIEMYGSQRDFSMQKPAELNAYADAAGAAIVEWSAVSDADGYKIYRKEQSDGPWNFVATVQQPAYEDTGCASGTVYSYTVVPYYESAGETYCGNFSYNGVSIQM